MSCDGCLLLELSRCLTQMNSTQNMYWPVLDQQAKLLSLLFAYLDLSETDVEVLTADDRLDEIEDDAYFFILKDPDIPLLSVGCPEYFTTFDQEITFNPTEDSHHFGQYDRQMIYNLQTQEGTYTDYDCSIGSVSWDPQFGLAWAGRWVKLSDPIAFVSEPKRETTIP